MGSKINETKNDNNQNNGSFWSGAYIDPRQATQQQQDDPEIVKYKEQLIEAARYLAEHLPRENHMFNGFSNILENVSFSVSNGVVSVAATFRGPTYKETNPMAAMYGGNGQRPAYVYPPYVQPYSGAGISENTTKRIVACAIVSCMVTEATYGRNVPRLDEITTRGCQSKLIVNKVIVNFVDAVFSRCPASLSTNELNNMVYTATLSCIDRLVREVKQNKRTCVVHMDGTVENLPASDKKEDDDEE